MRSNTSLARLAPAAIISLIGNRYLISSLVHRDIVGRYRGSFVGLAWSFLNPLLMLAVYTFVFSTIFQSKWSTIDGGSKTDFALMLFVGIIVHAALAECLNRAPTLILANESYVKKVVFPLEVLAWVPMGSAAFHALVSVIAFVLAEILLGREVPLSTFLAPVVLVPLVGFSMGLSWIVAACTVYFRDLAQATGIVTSAMMFLAPVFYPVAAIPEAYRSWLYLNPLTLIIEQMREVLINGGWPDWSALAAYTLASAIFGAFGYWCFNRMKTGFADAL